jgi:carbamoyl-phosphate synthase small subunit
MKTRIKSTEQTKFARLVLEDGSEYSGYSFGKARSQAGEVVFYTGMSGYPQYLTDPAFRGQILVAAYPMIGNAGIVKTGEAFGDEPDIPIQFESTSVQVNGLLVSETCDEPSHYSSGYTLSAWLEKNNVPGIYGIDTRSLVKRLRENGVMQGKILVEGSRDITLDSGIVQYPVSEASSQEIKTYLPAKSGDKKAYPKIAIIDCGVKTGLLRFLLSRNVEVIRLPWNNNTVVEYDGLILSSGPGDPKAYGKTIATVRRAFELKKPIFGIGLGAEIMALAAGADTYKLPYGHRSQNQPCIESGTNRCYITSQNHGYAIRNESLPRGWEPWFVNANDNTIEGIRSIHNPFQAVQFNPEGCPGPRDTEFLIDKFLDQVRGTNAFNI